MRQWKKSGFRLASSPFVFSVIGISLNLVSASSWAAPCCARNSAAPMLIVGDDEVQLGVGTVYGSAVAEPNSAGVPVYNSTGSDISQTLRLDGAFLLSDRFQLGMGVAVMNHSVTDYGITDSTVGLGDARVGVGYEILPSWSYSNWRPQVFLFAGATIPIGRSKYEFQKPSLSDVTGNGFYTASLGSLLIRRWGDWDFFLMPEVHYGLPRTFQSSFGSNKVFPGFGGSLGVGVGMSPGGGNLRVGIRVQPRLDQPTATSLNGAESVIGSGVLSVCDAGIDASYLLGSTDSLMLSYTDQTWIGVATHLTLTRSLALNFQHRWER